MSNKEQNDKKRKHEEEVVSNKSQKTAQKRSPRKEIEVSDDFPQEEQALYDFIVKKIIKAEIGDDEERIANIFACTFAKHCVSFVALYPDASKRDMSEAFLDSKQFLKEKTAKRAMAKVFTIPRDEKYYNDAEDLEYDTHAYLNLCAKVLVACMRVTDEQAARYLSDQFCYYARGQKLIKRGQIAALKETLTWINIHRDHDFALDIYVNEAPYFEFKECGTILQAIEGLRGALVVAGHFYLVGHEMHTDNPHESEFKKEPSTDDEENEIF